MSALHGAVDDLPRCCLVGRVPETTELRRRLSEAMSGSGALCLLCGEEGIGKTRLAEEVAREARDLGIEVRWGRCLPETVAPPLWPWRQALLGHGAPLAAPAAPAVDAPLPALDFAALLEPHDAESRFRVLHTAVSQLARLTASRPLLLILEDLHLADEASLELLRLLARVVPEMPLLCLGTTRRVGDSVGLCGEQWTALLRESHLLPLRGLTPEAAAALLEQLPSPPLSVERVAQLCQYTNGNPYFLRGVARALASSSAGETRAAELPLPDDLRQTISARIAALPVTAQQLLRAAAILGEEFEVALAACAAGLTQAEQDAALRAAESDGVLVLLAPPRESAAFRHPIVEKALQQELGSLGRASLHLAIARAIEASGGAGPDPLARLAHHYAAALPLGSLDKALHYLTAAAEHARTSLAPQAMAAHLERAAALLDAAQGGTARLCRLLIELGDAQRRLGHAEEARAACGRAAAIARALGDPRLLAEAVLGQGLRLDGFASTFVEDAAVLAGLREALAALPAEAVELRARCLARLSLELHHSEELAHSREAASTALRLAEELGDARVLLVALHAHVLSHAGPDLPPTALLDAAARIIHIAIRLNDREAEFHGHHVRVAASLARGDRSALDLAIAACSRIAAEQHLQRCVWQVQVFAAMRALLSGRLSEVAKLAQGARDAGLALVGQAADEVLATQLFDLQWALGRLGETAQAHLERAERYPQASAWTPGLIVALLSAGRRIEARAHFDRLMAGGLDGIRRDELWLVTMALLGEAAARLGATEAAAELRERLSPFAGQGIDIRFGRHLIGTVDRVLGLLAGALGRREEASVRFEAADAFHVRLGAMRWLVEARCDHAELLLSGGAGDRLRADSLMESALAIARELGLEGAVGRIAALRAGALTRREPSPQSGVFLRDGAGWRVGLGFDSARVADCKGLRHLALLLARPGQALHVLALVEGEASGLNRAVPKSLPLRRALGDAGPALDGRARAAYRRRLLALRAELQQADEWADLGRKQRLEAEIETLSTELAAAFGLRGGRPSADHVERLRKAVSKCIRDALGRIEAVHPELGQHLRRALRLGVTCAYLPSTAVRWHL